jgi:hypothetical protein
MNDAALVSMIYRITDFRHQFQATPSVEVVLIDMLKKRPAINELHGEVGLIPSAAISSSGLIDSRDARVL